MVAVALQEIRHKKRADARHQQYQERRDNDSRADAPRMTVGLGDTVPIGKLVAKKIEAFVFANLAKTNGPSEAVTQELQRRPLHPGKKCRTGKQHSRRDRAIPFWPSVVEFLDLAIGELIEIVEDKKRRRGVLRFRRWLCAAVCRQSSDDGGGAPDLFGSEVQSAVKIDHHVRRRGRSAKCLGKEL